jgi:hypothetical protein
VRKLASLLVLLPLGAATAWTQLQEAAPQTARQALVEMFFSKTSGTLVKHLPAATLNALEKSGTMAGLQQYSLLAGQLQAKEKTIETFETGPRLLVVDDAQAGQKFEIIVDSDSANGDQDEIAVSFQTYKDKQLQRMPYLPRMTFAMKMESGIWKLNEIQITVRWPLTDPDLLKGVTEAMKARIGAAGVMQPQMQTSSTSLGNDASVLAAMQTIIKAENTYSSTYRGVGYTCTLSDLDGFGGGSPNEHQAMLIPSGLASGKRYGYIFTLSGCTGSPAASFRLVAVPGVNSFERRAWCTDQAGVIRYSADGNPATCMASGMPAQ